MGGEPSSPGLNIGRDPSLSPFTRALLAGAVAGLTVDLTLFPLDTLKTRLQSSSGFLASGGFRNVYRGIGSVFLGSAPGAALFFVSYEGVKSSAFTKSYLGGKDTPAASMLASAIGEVAACTVRVPVEVVKQRAQATGTGSSLAAVKYVVNLGKDRGLLGVWREIYRGYGVTIMREIPFTMIQFPLWEGMKKWCVRVRGGGDRRASGAESAVCGSVAGGVAAAVTTPLDVMKTRMMLAEKSISMASMFRKIVAEEGARTLLSGIGPRVMWISAGGAVFLGAYTGAANALSEL
ncbi:S-adenosylmethionine transporter [Orbilia oligospora]|uniref:S-adenosylmethionine transporter n=1 Tax=Orbilia oligospora TaxID=2813651 RepID=A0A7C8JHQ8_ORBOL|nr:S-adenosylmethionine transporter [Orbilia oligospora]KAF3110791.1 S-adenosylmethionine transporter [Orbilia oligospora]KAF3113407.1 S-adenosylmethionine transporter [Orbilia oligospora]KAF3132214.1 S-adenosylmethionine transporter [Orbilia oligospora]KAF3134863.1 S-adenosylmethionine transporter [Orbilia oligospora]